MKNSTRIALLVPSLWLLGCDPSGLTSNNTSDASADASDAPMDLSVGTDGRADLDAAKDTPADALDASTDASGEDQSDEVADARQCPEARSPEAGLAFPTAEGFGRFAAGGRGGRVIEITTLADAGPGSMRACLEAQGPRTCVFRTSGTITLQSNMRIEHPFVTLAGQTAPGQGVLVRGNQIEAYTHDVIIQHMRTATGPANGSANGSTGGIEAFEAQRVIVDHCTMTWAPDDTASVWGETTQDVTYQWNVIAEGLNLAGFGKGMVLGGGAKRISVLHNLIAHHADRLPQIQVDEVQMVNNMVYNSPGNINVNPAPTAVRASFVGNYLKQGPDAPFPISTTIRTLARGWRGQVDYPQSHDDDTKLYLLDNYHSRLRTDAATPEADIVYQGGAPLPIVSSPIAGFPTLYSVIPSSEVPQSVDAMGATRPTRLSIDARILQSVQDGTGDAKLDRPADVGGWPEIPVEVRPEGYDTDADGMPDEWERQHGFDPQNPADGVGDADSDSYTNLEEFLQGDDPHCPS